MIILYYCNELRKTVPCEILPNEIITEDTMISRNYYCTVKYDELVLNDYDLTMVQIKKSCKEYIDLHRLYPAENQEDIDYYNSFIDTGIVDRKKELKRYEKLYNCIMNSTVTSYIAYTLCNLIITDLQFKFLTHQEKLFMRALSDIVFSELPQEQYDLLFEDAVPEFMRVIRTVFIKTDLGVIFPTHTLINYNKIVEYDYVFPLELNVINIQNNLEYVFTNNSELFD